MAAPFFRTEINPCHWCDPFQGFPPVTIPRFFRELMAKRKGSPWSARGAVSCVPRKHETEGIRIFLFPSTLCERNLTIPQSKIKDFCQLPLHKGAVRCSRTSAFIDVSQKNNRIVPHSFFDCLNCPAERRGSSAYQKSTQNTLPLHKGAFGKRIATPV